jgi:hypothetical protein
MPRIALPSTTRRRGRGDWAQSPLRGQSVDFATGTTTVPKISRACWFCGLSRDVYHQCRFQWNLWTLAGAAMRKMAFRVNFVDFAPA